MADGSTTARPGTRSFSSFGYCGSVLLLTALSVCFYLNSLSGEFVWDDRQLILNNRLIQETRFLGEALLSDFWADFDDPRRFRNYYRPVVTLTYFLDYSVWGDSPAGFHGTNVLLHGANVLLLYGVTFVLFGSRETSLVVAALFAVHPVHTESVAWISGRTDLLGSALVLASFSCYLTGTRVGPSKRWLLLSGLLFTLALLAKEVAIVLPIALLAHRHWLIPRVDGPRAFAKRVISTQLGIAGAYFLVRWLVFEMPIFAETRRPVGLLLVNLPRILDRYLLKLVAPVKLYAHDPMVWLLPKHWLPLTMASFAVLAAAWAVFSLGRRDQRALFGGSWCLIFLLPVLNAGTFTDVLTAERFLYLPSAGFCWVLGSVYELAARRGISLGLLRLVATALILTGGLRTWQRNPVWRNEMVLFEDMARHSPEFPLPHLLLGDAHQREGDPASALRHYERALALDPNNCHTLNASSLAQLELGVSRRSGPILDAGFEFIQRAIQLCPDDDQLHHTLAEYYLRQDHLEQSVAEFRQAIALNPYRANYYYNLGAVLFASGKREEARPYLETFVRMGPKGAHRLQALDWLRQ